MRPSGDPPHRFCIPHWDIDGLPATRNLDRCISKYCQHRLLATGAYSPTGMWGNQRMQPSWVAVPHYFVDFRECVALIRGCARCSILLTSSVISVDLCSFLCRVSINPASSRTGRRRWGGFFGYLVRCWRWYCGLCIYANICNKTLNSNLC